MYSDGDALGPGDLAYLSYTAGMGGLCWLADLGRRSLRRSQLRLQPSRSRKLWLILCTHCEHLDSEQGKAFYPMNLRHRGSHHGRAHVSSTHSLRTSSSPRVMAKGHTSTCRFGVWCVSEIALAFSSFSHLRREKLCLSPGEETGFPSFHASS